MTFGGLLDTFKGFFSRAFWFSNFLPVAIVASLHMLVATLVYDLNYRTLLTDVTTSGTALVLFAGLVVLSYALAPLTTLFGGLLDGSLMPRWLHDQLRADRAAEWRADDVEWRAAMTTAAGAEKAALEVPRRFAAAVSASRLIVASERNATKEAKRLIDKAASLLEALGQIPWNQTVQTARPLPLDRLEEVVKAVEEAVNSTTAAFIADKSNAGALKLLKETRSKVIALLGPLRNSARQQFRDVSDRLELYDPQTWQATRLGDARYALGRYVRDIYNVEFAYMWPRVRMALADGESADGKGMPRQVADAAAQVDFATALMALAVSVPLVWLVVIIVNGGPTVLFAALAITSPIALRLCYELVVRSEIAFGGTARTAIDRYRFTALTLLSIPLPATFSAERELWAQLAQTSFPDAKPELVFLHAKASPQ